LKTLTCPLALPIRQRRDLPGDVIGPIAALPPIPTPADIKLNGIARDTVNLEEDDQTEQRKAA
jgi:hypothetical protein